MAVGHVPDLGDAQGHQPRAFRADPAERLPDVRAGHEPGHRPAPHRGGHRAVMFVLGGALQWGFQTGASPSSTRCSSASGCSSSSSRSSPTVGARTSGAWARTVNPYATQSVAVGPLVFPTPTLIAFVVASSWWSAPTWCCERTYPGRALRAFAPGPGHRLGVRDRPRPPRHPARRLRRRHRRAGRHAVRRRPDADAGQRRSSGSASSSRSSSWAASATSWGRSSPARWLMMVAGLVSLWSPAATPLVVFSAIVVALLFRPRGLFARRAG